MFMGFYKKLKLAYQIQIMQQKLMFFVFMIAAWH